MRLALLIIGSLLIGVAFAFYTCACVFDNGSLVTIRLPETNRETAKLMNSPTTQPHDADDLFLKGLR